MIRFAVIVLTLAALSFSAFAGRASGQFVSEQREKTLRSLIPDAELAANPRLILYTERLSNRRTTGKGLIAWLGAHVARGDGQKFHIRNAARLEKSDCF